MRGREKRKGAGVSIALLLVIVLGLLAGAVWWLQQLPRGPVEIAWDKEACAHCRMHVSEPAFAAQLQLQDGRVLNFDDPGCALRHVAEVPPVDVHALYFHEARADGWLTREETAFVELSPTPMGFGLGAVRIGTAGALSFDEAGARVRKPSLPRVPSTRLRGETSWQ